MGGEYDSLQRTVRLGDDNKQLTNVKRAPDVLPWLYALVVVGELSNYSDSAAIRPSYSPSVIPTSTVFE